MDRLHTQAERQDASKNQSFTYGFSFALGMALVRFFFVR
jgi:hypothetical protein